MYINNHTNAWTDVFQDTAQCCISILNSVLDGDGTVGTSVRDAALLIAQFTISNALFEALPESEISTADQIFVKKILVSTCGGLLDNRTNAYSQISRELGTVKFIDQIPLRLIRKILGIASGLSHKDNDQFLSELLKSLNSIRTPVEKLLSATPPLPHQGGLGLNYPQAAQSRIRTRKSRTPGKHSLN